jgi:hypothetical protein
MAKQDEAKMQKLIRKLQKNTEKKTVDKRRKYDPTLQPDDESAIERKEFFSEMKKREF